MDTGDVEPEWGRYVVWKHNKSSLLSDFFKVTELHA